MNRLCQQKDLEGILEKTANMSAMYQSDLFFPYKNLNFSDVKENHTWDTV